MEGEEDLGHVNAAEPGFPGRRLRLLVYDSGWAVTGQVGRGRPRTGP
jgi:hypothetical protein